jgi:pentatricopeptide repeat protein
LSADATVDAFLGLPDPESLLTTSCQKQQRNYGGLRNEEEQDRGGGNDELVSAGRRENRGSHDETLWAYYNNLQTRRRQQYQDEISTLRITKDYLLKPARSLAYYLMENTVVVVHDDDDTVADVDTTIVVPLQRAIIQAIRISASMNDYKLIIRLIEAVQNFAGGTNIIDPSIIGFAISGLCSTSVNIGKIKHVWNDLTSSPLLSRPIGPLEINAYLQALVQHKKIRAALDLYKTTTTTATDAYSLSIIFNALKTSIQDKQPDAPFIEKQTSQHISHSLAYFYSECWQWNEALCIMDDIQKKKEYTKLNNAVFTALLRLNERAAAIFNDEHGKTERVIMILKLMKACKVFPDEVSATLILSGLDKQWELAVKLLHSYTDHTSWSFPKPNIYMYSAAMTVCARSKRYQTTLQLMEDMKSHGLTPNVWIYNSILQALCGKDPQETRIRQSGQGIKRAARERAKQRMALALQLFFQMEVEPDKVTFNTLLSAVAGSSRYMDDKDWDMCAHLAFGTVRQPCIENSLRFVEVILDQMEGMNIQSDAITYRNAIRIARGEETEGVLALVKRGISTRKREMFVEIFDAGLSKLAESGNLNGIVGILRMMNESKINPDAKCNEHIISALSMANTTHLIPYFFKKDTNSSEVLEETLLIDSSTLKSVKSSLDASHFSIAFSCCVQSGDLKSAQSVLEVMQRENIKPSQTSLGAITHSYALLALDSRSYKSSKSTRLDVARARASSALSLLSSIQTPSATLLSTVAKACCSTGMFQEALSIVKRIHDRVLNSQLDTRNRVTMLKRRDQNLRVLPHLHRMMFKYCANQGNVTNALRLCEKIQYLAKHLKATSQQNKEQQERSGLRDSMFAIKRQPTWENIHKIGMSAEDWTLLITAASKSGHWRVCVTSLQFLRPYLEATKPSCGREKEAQRRNYAIVEPAFNTAVNCLAIRSQYAWIVRLIDDWIRWCGRRPPRDAVLAAIRVLSSRGRGEEVNNLLARCTSIPSSKTKLDNGSYELMVFVGAITSLYNEGHYDDADDAFLSAISKKILPLNLKRKGITNQRQISLDLHGMNLAVAHSAVRIALQQLAITGQWGSADGIVNQLIIVTGRGLNSEFRMQPVLRPEVQQMLLEEFYPPLSSTSLPGNMGALLIASEDISAWIAHQKIQKSARMLMIAAMLRNYVSPHGRIFNSLLRVADVKQYGI